MPQTNEIEIKVATRVSSVGLEVDCEILILKQMSLIPLVMPLANSEDERTMTSLENYILDQESTSAEEFVKRLLAEGYKYPHDKRSAFLGRKEDLPHFYNEVMFKKGQDFYRKHILGIFLGCFLALFAGLSQPLGKILVMTNRSSTPMTSFRRYTATIMHMCTWYESDFEPGSKLWSSVNKVRKMHNAASKQSQSRLNYPLTQYDMSVVIIAFMGFPLIRSKMVGIHNISEEEIKCFLHFWRVMGYLFGIEDKFNICRDSVEVTKEITTLLLQKDLIPKIKEGASHFETLSKAFIGGMQGLLPYLNYDQTIDYLHMMIDSISDSDSFRKLAPPRKRSKWNLITCLVQILQYDFGRIIMNVLLRTAL